MDAQIASYTTTFTTYATAVPYIADELNAGIAALNALEPTADYQTKIDAIWSEYTGKANSKLNTMFDGKIVAFENLRRAAGGKSPYISVGDSIYPMVDTYAGGNAQFTLESTTYGDNNLQSYYMYNAETGKYYGVDNVPVDTKEEATSIRFMLNANSGYVGINIFANGVTSGYYAFNANTYDNTSLTYWAGADGGSIWNVVEYSDDAALEEAISSVTTALEPYIPNVPEEIAEILEAAVNNAKELKYSANLGAEAEALRTDALADANAELKALLGGKKWALKSLRNGYATVAEGDTVVNKITNSVSEYNTYEFIKEADGGFKIYNQEVKVFFGPLISVGNETYVSLVSAYKDALEVYPVLNHGGNYYGIALPYTNGGTQGFNTNAQGLHGYGINDGGSIFKVEYQGDVTTAIVEVEGAEDAHKGIYDLSGRKLSAPVRGINIINGRKVLVK